jgi:hypothetical protein
MAQSLPSENLSKIYFIMKTAYEQMVKDFVLIGKVKKCRLQTDKSGRLGAREGTAIEHKKTHLLYLLRQ